jgi:dethiobiotin synthetase
VTDFFVTGAGTDIGKTHVACALLRAWRARGLACAALKPVLSGFDETALAESDSGRLLNALGEEASAANVAAMTPWLFSAPLSPPAAARAEGREIPYEAVVAACQRLIGADVGAALIEGAGGVMSPIAEDKTNLDLIAALNLPALLVTGSYLGAISHTLTAVEAMRARRVKLAAIVVSASVVSAEPLAETAAGLAAFHEGPIFAVPRFLGGVPAEIAALADFLIPPLITMARSLR